MDNYYEILGVAEDADDRAIKSAYRKLAKESHPDTISKDADDSVKHAATEKFKKINEAYAALSDAEQRKQYDYQRKNPHGQYNFDWSRAQGQAQNDPFFREMASSFMDNFVIFGDGNTFHINFGGPRQQPKENRTCNFDLELYPEMVGSEQEATINIPRHVYCKQCDGKGCKQCGNRGWNQTVENKKIKVPANSVGKRIRMKEMGWQMDPALPPGDLYLRISLKDSPNFRILNGFNLETMVKADPTIAIIGGCGIMVTLDGEQRAVELQPGMANGSRIRLGKHGVIVNGEKTELVGVLIYDAPTSLSEEQREALVKYQKELECQTLPRLGDVSAKD